MVTTEETKPKTRVKIVAVGGLAKNGKTTLCHLLQSHAQSDGWHCQYLAFADPLKSIVRIVQQDFVNKNPDALQATSDHWKMNYGSHCFAKDLTARIQAHWETVPSYFDKILYLVGDLRFRVELDALDAYASVSRELYKVRVVRPGFDQFDRNMLHPSETELLDIQYENFRVEAPDMDTLVTDSMELWKLIKT